MLISYSEPSEKCISVKSVCDCIIIFVVNLWGLNSHSIKLANFLESNVLHCGIWNGQNNKFIELKLNKDVKNVRNYSSKPFFHLQYL